MMKKIFVAFICAMISLSLLSEIRKSSIAAFSIQRTKYNYLPDDVVAVQYIGQIDNKQYIETHIVP